MRKHQVFFLYCAQCQAQLIVWTWSCPGAALCSLSLVTFPCRGMTMGNPWGFVHFLWMPVFQVDQKVILAWGPQQHLVFIHIEGKVALTFHNDQQNLLFLWTWWCTTVSSRSSAWLKVLWHVLGHVLDALLCLLSLCHSSCYPCSCWLVCGTSPSARCALSHRINQRFSSSCLLPARRLETHLIHLKLGSKIWTGYHATHTLYTPMHESSQSICCIWRSFFTHLLTVRHQCCLTGVVSLKPDEMHCLAEGSILVASWLAGSSDIQSPQ